MEISKGAITAIVTAFGRAYHSLYDEPKIFDDYLAKDMMTKETFDFIAHSLAGSLSFFDPEAAARLLPENESLAYVMRAQSAPISLARARYTEDYLEMAVREGFTQYVLLGAGMDTFAFRRPDMLERLHVYELDQPVTQGYKLARIGELGWKVPENLSFISIDLSKEELASALYNKGFSRKERSVFNWLGVTYYLEKADVLSTFSRIAEASAPGSMVVFDYLDMDAFDDAKASHRVKTARQIVSNAGEPMKSGFEMDEMKALLTGAGLELIEDLDTAAMQKAYFSGRTDGYTALEHFHIARARAKEK
ncbi:MAG TPA: class I SAM-dependent methyltransferase [Clostridia bacterium]|nr:class I SAM-dependent methyltransferase [Clostridia bacterium]